MSNTASPIEKRNVEAQPKSKPAVVHYPFWFGGSAASMAAVVTHPLDLSTWEPPLLTHTF